MEKGKQKSQYERLDRISGMIVKGSLRVTTMVKCSGDQKVPDKGYSMREQWK